MNINAIINSALKNPTNIILLVGAFAGAYFVAKKVLAQQNGVQAMAAIPQYSSESEVTYPRTFSGVDWGYTDPSNFPVQDVMNLDDYSTGSVAIPKLANSFYSAEDIITDEDAYAYAQDYYDDINDY